MSRPAVQCNNIGKRYRVGQAEPYRTLRDTIVTTAGAPFRYVKSRLSGEYAGSREFWALRDVSFEIGHGEAVGVIGRNGAGKSTLLKVLSRITAPTTGTAKIHGRIGSLLEVGTGFHPELTGRENIYLSGSILGMRRAEIQRKFDEIVQFAEIGEFIDTPVKRYSSGMYVRLAFSVAAHLEPEILIVDEVLAVGDLQFQKKCLGKMQDVGREGRTVLFVSHNLSSVTTLCSRAILLDHGRIVRDGPSADVVSHYLSAAAGASGTTVWSDLNASPGTNGFKLVYVSLQDEKGKPLNVASAEQPLQLKIGYYLSTPGLKFRVTAGLYTGGNCAFMALEPRETVHDRAGLYYSTLEIPANLLAEREYTVYVSVFASRGKKMHFCVARDVVAFQVFDPMTGGSARGDYAEGLDGSLRPKLEWRGEYAGQGPFPDEVITVVQ